MRVRSCSPLHSVWGVTLRQRESRSKILLHHSIAQVLHKSAIDILLQLLAIIRGLGSWRLLLKELVRSRYLGLVLLEGLVGDLVDGDALQVDLGGRGDSVHLVNSLNWNTVDLEWTSHCKESRLQLLKEHDSLTPESSRKQDEHLSWSDRASELGSLWSLSLEWSFLIISWVPVVLLGHLHEEYRYE